MTTPNWLTAISRWCKRRWTVHDRAERRLKRQMAQCVADHHKARAERRAELAALQAELDRIGPRR